MDFHGEYYFLNNFSPSPMAVTVGNMLCEFDNVEAAYQAGRCPEKADSFLGLSGFQAYKLGKQLEPQPDWDSMKDEWMLTLLVIKFRDPVLKRKLLNTDGTELIFETNMRDTYWGRYKGVGENRLGQLLMKVRDMLKIEC